jgi:hypothetical protein
MATYFFETITAARALTAASLCCVAAAGAEPAAGGGGGKAKGEKPAAPEAPAAGAEPAAEKPEAEGAAAAADETPAAAAPSLAEPASLGFAKIQHPAGATSVSHAGQVYEADKKGVITVPLAAVEDLTAHGFSLVD